MRSRTAQYAHEGQLIDDSLLLRRLQDLAEAKDDADDTEQHQNEEDDDAPRIGFAAARIIPARAASDSGFGWAACHADFALCQSHLRPATGNEREVRFYN